MSSQKQSTTAKQDQYKPVINEWALKAQQHYQTNNLESARYWAEKTTELDESNITAWNVLGRIAFDEKSLSQAERLFKQALSLAPNSEETLINLGYSYLAQENYNAAKRCFERALGHSTQCENARISLAYTAMLQGEIKTAFSAYRKLFREGIDHPHVIDALIDCAEQFTADSFLPELAMDITDLLAYEDIDHQRLAPLALSLLMHRYQLHNNDAQISFEDLCEDSLLIATLQRCAVNSAPFEVFIKSVREALLRICTSSDSLADNAIPLVIAMGIHQAYTAYAASFTTDEEHLVLNLEDAIAEQLKVTNAHPNDVVGALLIVAMYKALYSLECSFGLAKYDLEEWPIGAQAVLDLAFYQPQQHAIFKHTVNEHFSDADTDTLALATPYWESLSKQQTVEFHQSLYQELLTSAKTKPELLVLSCDAGQGALRVATHFPELEIVVIEPNRSNVAYALMQAANLKISNIEFRCGNIAEVLEDQKFSLIECSDWLDYVEDSDLLITQLLAHLHDDGVIKLSLDSSVAKNEIEEVQQFIVSRKLAPKAAEVRMIRDSILAQGDDRWQSILSAPWFYQAARANNKLFHQRHFYTIDDVSDICKKHHLSFLGFSQHGKQELSQWLQLEQDKPASLDTYHMVCEKLTEKRRGGGDIVLIKHAPIV